MSIYDKKLYIKKTDGIIQTANLYTDKSDVGDNYLTFKYNGNTVYAVLNSNGDIDFNVSYNHNLYKIKHEAIQWKTDEYIVHRLYPSIYRTMTELPNDRDWTEFVKYRKDLSNMFCYSERLTTVPPLDTQNVTNMGYMFYKCLSLITIPLFNTLNVISMNGMFFDCWKLKEVPLFNTQNVLDISNMFRNCKSLTKVQSFDTSNVIDMSYMFYSCSNLTELPIFDIRSVTNIKNMIVGTQITKITFKNKPVNLEVTPEILGKPDVQITFI